MKKIFPLIVAVLMALIFIYAGSIKLTNLLSFYQDIGKYHLLPDEMAWGWAHYLPWLEVAAGLSLLWKRIRFVGGLVIAFLLLTFIGAISSAWIRGLNIECGCFGEQMGSSSYAWILIRDVLMLLATLYVLGISLSSKGLSFKAERMS